MEEAIRRLEQERIKHGRRNPVTTNQFVMNPSKQSDEDNRPNRNRNLLQTHQLVASGRTSKYEEIAINWWNYKYTLGPYGASKWQL